MAWCLKIGHDAADRHQVEHGNDGSQVTEWGRPGDWGPAGKSPNPIQRYLSRHPIIAVTVAVGMLMGSILLFLLIPTLVNGNWFAFLAATAFSVAVGIGLAVWMYRTERASPESRVCYLPWFQRRRTD